MLNKPLKNEKNIAKPNALPAFPFCAITYPSKVVAIEEGVPGKFNKIAGINPPDIPPLYNPINKAIPDTGSIVIVIGINIATAIFALKPGLDPNNNPTITTTLI